MNSPVIVALDTVDMAWAKAMVRDLAPHIYAVKLGLEFFAAHGPQGVREVASGGTPAFVDLKLHDIPTTVGKAVKALAPLNPAFLTVHASNDEDGLKAAVKARDEAGMQTKLLAVTVLTTMDEGSLDRIGQKGPVTAQVNRLARLAKDSGIDGIVCSPLEVAGLREALGPDIILVTPGVRPAGADMNDQKRVMTPSDAFNAGANFLVIGRPVTEAKNPVVAARDIAQQIRAECRFP
jgi:orotidine-5'-phosphate decarboxylase